jgi:alkanesulfonate monooxygenase SsuD/methylene tetrahydromethanopterin reductase-like flavin-dependent oxidoreductase (luciferase family)
VNVGIYIRDYMEDPHRSIHQQIEEAAEVCRLASSLGFWAIYTPQHYIGYPSVWLQPLQILARLAPDAQGMKLITGIILLPYHNPVDIAEQTVTLDHISNGRFILGVGLGYREKELEAFGTNRRERVSRFEESLHLMKLLWSGEEVTFQGKHWRVHEGRLSLTPVQKPHPPIWIAAQSRGAVHRAALMGDACVIGPQPNWDDFHCLARLYRESLAELGKEGQGLLAANRSITIDRNRDRAIRDALAAGEAKAAQYRGFEMQERTTVDFGLAGGRPLPQWAITGTPEECVELISRCHEEDGLEFIGLACLNLPKEHSARLEYVQMIGEEFVRKLPA